LVVAGGASGTTPILEMDRSDVLRVHVEVPESDSVDIHQGDSVQINLQEYPNKIFTGSVTNVSGSLNPQSRTLPVEIIIDNHNQILKPGAYVEVHFKHAISTPPVIIPSNAAITKSDGTYVAIVNKNMIQYKRVKIHQDNGDTLAIDSGISPNDLVVADSGLTLPAGTVVKPETNTDW
jgi:RND family efflux transporter MFP subunit